MTATLITDFSGHVTKDRLLPIVTDDNQAGFQVANQVCLVLDGELLDARQGPNRTWTAVAFGERHAEAARQYNQNPAQQGAWVQSSIALK